MRSNAGLLGILALFTRMACAQPAPQPHFEVATVKLAGPILSTKPELAPGRFQWTTQIAYLAGYAYSLDTSRVSGQQLGGAVYEISAVFEPAATDDQVRLMLQSLLAERFKMRVHRKTAEVDGYGIIVAKGGIKIKEAAATEPPEKLVFATSPSKGVIAINGKQGSIAQLAVTLGRVTGKAIWDRTGLAGAYDFSFRFSQDLSAGSPSEAPSIETALRDLGLSLQKQKGPRDTLVIDSIEQPSDN